MLYQELQILKLLGNKISEIHLTDYAYKYIYTDSISKRKSDNKFILAFQEFINYITLHYPNINLYVHTDPDKLKNSVLCQRRFDIIYGIDIDSIIYNDNRAIMKEIGNHTLKMNGVMIISQHNLDQVDLCHYEIMEDDNINGINQADSTIKLISTTDYVKSPYFIKYSLQSIFYKLFYPLNFLGLLISGLIFKKSFITSILTGSYCLFGLFYKYLFSDDSNNFKRIIKDFDDLIKK